MYEILKAVSEGLNVAWNVALSVVALSDVGSDCCVERRNVRLGGAFVVALNLLTSNERRATPQVRRNALKHICT